MASTLDILHGQPGSPRGRVGSVQVSSVPGVCQSQDVASSTFQWSKQSQSQVRLKGEGHKFHLLKGKAETFGVIFHIPNPQRQGPSPAASWWWGNVQVTVLENPLTTSRQVDQSPNRTPYQCSSLVWSPSHLTFLRAAGIFLSSQGLIQANKAHRRLVRSLDYWYIYLRWHIYFSLNKAPEAELFVREFEPRAQGRGIRILEGCFIQEQKNTGDPSQLRGPWTLLWLSVFALSFPRIMQILLLHMHFFPSYINTIDKGLD